MSEAVELNVSVENIQKLLCSMCEGYLMCAPIRILPDGRNICGHCVPEHKDILIYKNTTLEAILTHAVFPCKFQPKGCTKRLHFNVDADHEDTCLFNVTEVSASSDGKQALMDTTEPCKEGEHTVTINTETETLPNCIKSSASTTSETEGSKVENASFVVPKAGKSTVPKTSVCTEADAAPSTAANWPSSTGRQQERASSVASNRSRNSWNGRSSSITSNRRPNVWQDRSPGSFNRPYRLDLRNNWQFDRQHNFRPEHVNVYKRRNNVIIVKGGTFYVNW